MKVVLLLATAVGAQALKYGIYETAAVKAGEVDFDFVNGGRLSIQAGIVFKGDETFDLVFAGPDAVQTFGSLSGLNSFSYDDSSATMKHVNGDVTGVVNDVMGTIVWNSPDWNHAFVSKLMTPKIPQIEGVWDSYPTSGDTTQRIEQIAISQEGSDKVTQWGSISGRIDHKLEGNVMTMIGDDDITGEIMPCGKMIVFSQGLVLKRAGMAASDDKDDAKANAADDEHDDTHKIWIAIGISCAVFLAAFWLGSKLGDCCFPDKTYPGEKPKEQKQQKKAFKNSVILLSVPVPDKPKEAAYEAPAPSTGDEMPPIPKLSDLEGLRTGKQADLV